MIRRNKLNLFKLIIITVIISVTVLLPSIIIFSISETLIQDFKPSLEYLGISGAPIAEDFGSENIIIIDKYFEEPVLSPVIIENQPFINIDLKDCISMGALGNPALPVCPVHILVPQGKTVSEIYVNPSEEISLNYDSDSPYILPQQKEIPLSSTELPEFVINYSLYSTDKIIPDSVYENKGVDSMRGFNILTVNLNPVKYNPKKSELYYFSELEVVVTLNNKLGVAEESSEAFLRMKENDLNYVKSLVSNPQGVNSYSKPINLGTLDDPLNDSCTCDPSKTYEYVIITNKSLLNSEGYDYSWYDLLDHRRTYSGLNGTIVTLQQIANCSDYWNDTYPFNDSVYAIREFIRDAYQNWGTEYVLLGGKWSSSSQTQTMPYRLFTDRYESDTYDTMPCDLYFSNLDGNWWYSASSIWGGGRYSSANDKFSEVYVGRITAYTPEYVSNAVSKIIGYDTNAHDEEWLRTTTFAGSSLGWSVTSKEYMEELRLGTGAYSENVGFEEWNNNHPEYSFNTLENRYYYADGKWGLFSPSIESDNSSIINHLGHSGYYSPFSLTNWYYRNNSKPFIGYSQGCLAGRYSSGFAGCEQLLCRHPERHSFAVILNTGYGYGNSGSTYGPSQQQQKIFWNYFFDEVENNFSQWEIGKAQAYSKDEYSSYIDSGGHAKCYVWYSSHLFGDPAQRLKISIEETGANFVSLVSPENNGDITNQTPVFSFIVNDSDDFNNHCSLFINNNFIQSDNSTSNGVIVNKIYLNDSLSYGDYNWYINCSDGVNTVSSNSWSFSIVKNIGDICSSSGECESNYCIDGVCCSGECGLCEACNITGSEGYCTNQPQGLDLHNDCSQSECGKGYCNGFGSCEAYNDSLKHNCGECQYCIDSDTDCDFVPENQDPNSECNTGNNFSNGCVGEYCNGFGSCEVIIEEDGGCPPCGTCLDNDSNCEYYSNNSQDLTGPETCSYTCMKCNGIGECVNQKNNMDLFNQCDDNLECHTGMCDISGNCEVYSEGEKGSCGPCKYCIDNDSNCEYVPDGQDLFDDCTGLQCDDGSDTPYYWGWSSLTCFYRKDVSSESHYCKGDGTCYTEEEVCPNQRKGDSTNIICDCLEGQINCTGTDSGSCQNCSYQNYAPTIPVLIFPDNNSNTSDNSVDFDWNDSTDSNGDNISYYLSINSSLNSTVSLFHLNESEYASFSTTSDVTYYWRVRAYDGVSNSSWSSKYVFNEITIQEEVVEEKKKSSGGGGGGSSPVIETSEDSGDSITYELSEVTEDEIEETVTKNANVKKVLSDAGIKLDNINDLSKNTKEIYDDVSVDVSVNHPSSKSSSLDFNFKYKNRKKMNKVMIFIEVPKSFAESARNITLVSSIPYDTMEVVQDDPVYYFYYEELESENLSYSFYNEEYKIGNKVMENLSQPWVFADVENSPECGNGILEEGEECDISEGVSRGYECSENCILVSVRCNNDSNCTEKERELGNCKDCIILEYPGETASEKSQSYYEIIIISIVIMFGIIAFCIGFTKSKDKNKRKKK